MVRQRLYTWLLMPKSSDENVRPKELILNILLLGIVCLTTILFAISFIGNLVLGARINISSLLVQLTIVAVFVLLLALSRRGLRWPVAYVFIGIFFSLAAWAVFMWGVGLPLALLAFGLIIVMTGVLLSSRMALCMVGLIYVTLMVVYHLSETGTIRFDNDWMNRPPDYIDITTYGLIFAVTALVAWLSNREIERLLVRARQSEKELLHERNLLEIKVKERTRALEKAQVEKMLDLQRFAEFGRLSATLLHELTNPLMSVSLNLEQLQGKNRSNLVKHAREGIAHMEQYVEAARRQLRNQSEIKLFDIAAEIERVAGLVEAKAKTQQVKIKLDLVEGVNIRGDSIRFNHIISNLMTNAIDAYDGMRRDDKEVHVNMVHEGQTVRIVVQDYGRGITKTQLPHLFEPFYTTKEASRGTGIGLAITKQAVEETFQGMITVTSDKKQGTQFVIRMPLL